MNKVSTKEFIWYAGCGLVIVLGLICMIFGIVGDHMSVPASQNFIKTFQEKIPFQSLRLWGVLFLAIGLVVGVIVLLYNAKKADREVEKKIRREQRLAAQSAMNVEVKNAVEVVEEKPAEPAPEEAK